MNKNIPNIFAIILCLVLIIATVYFNGCQNTNNIEETNVASSEPSIEISIEKNPKSSSEGTGVSVSGSTYHSSLFNAWSTDPGETISRTEPVKFTTNEISFEGSSGNWGFLDTIWKTIKQFLWIGTLGIAGLFLLYFLVPAAQPIISGIFRFIASFIPFIGSIVERIFAGLQWKKPLEETISGGQKFKDSINRYSEFTTEQKEYITSLFNETMMQKQDEASQRVIREIKIAKGL